MIIKTVTDFRFKKLQCCVQLNQQGKHNHRFFLKQFTQAASLFKSPAPRGTSVFIHSSHNHASTNQHRSHHLTRQACSANQGLRACHPPNMGLFTAHRSPSGWPGSLEWLPTEFQIQSPKIHILSNKSMVRPITAIPHSWY